MVKGYKKVKFKEIVKIARSKDATISKLHIIMNMLQDKKFNPIQS